LKIEFKSVGGVMECLGVAPEMPEWRQGTAHSGLRDAGQPEDGKLSYIKPN